MLTIPDRDSMVINVLGYYANATPTERADGFRWYPSAYDSAVTYAQRYGVSVNVAAAVIAVLSPQVEWNANLRWSEEVISAYVSGNNLPRRGLTNSLRRAAIALSGDLTDVLRVDGTQKVRNFYGSIVGERGAVCIDRHAIRVALGDSYSSPGVPRGRGYELVADAYRDAARELGRGARHIQAVTWLVVRRERAAL